MSILTRRAFTAAGSAALLRATAPNDRVTVGIIGSGLRAVFECVQYPFFGNAEIVAVCDAQESRRSEAKQVLEKGYAEQGRAGRNIRAYRDYRELLRQPDIDAVYIATPDHWHVTQAIDAMKAKKHIHCEKPLGVSVEQDLAVLKAARDYRQVFQYGAESRSTVNARQGIELVLNGRIGKVTKVFAVAPPSATGGAAEPAAAPPAGFDYDLWLGPAPRTPFCADRCLTENPRGIFNIYDYTLGNIANWAAHPLDQVQRWADASGRTDSPVKYAGSGKIASGGLFDTAYRWDVRCTWSDGLELQVIDNVSYRDCAGAPQPMDNSFDRSGATRLQNGAVFIGTEGWIIVGYEKNFASNPALLESVIGPGERRLPVSALSSVPAGMISRYQQVATAGHHQNWIRAIRGECAAVGDLPGAVRSNRISLLSELVVRTGQSLSWDQRALTITGNEEARKRMKRPMRSPWGVS
jgi:hypothetical protein